MTTRYFIFDGDGSYTEGGEELFNLDDERTIAIVEDKDGRCMIEADQYYSKDGHFRLEITQPLARALRTFWAALQYDAQEEEAEKRV